MTGMRAIIGIVFLAIAGLLGKLGLTSKSDPTMQAILQAVGGSTVRGTAVVTLIKRGSEEHPRVRLLITGATKGKTLAWHVHAGACGSSAAAVGNAPYPPMTPDAEGAAGANTELPFALPSGALYVDVHDDAAVVSCGALK